MKIYKVVFNQYTNHSKDTVSNKKGSNYVDVGKEPFLIREDQIEIIKEFGNGIYSLEFVGNLWDERII